MNPDVYVLYGISTLFLVVGLVAYAMVVLDDRQHPRASRPAKE